MTVPSTNRSQSYPGTGLQTAFPFTFRVPKASDLRVVVTHANGTKDELVAGVGYTVVGIGLPNGGTVTTTAAPIVGDTLTVLREVALTQELDLRNQGPYFAEDVEAALDRSAMADQQIQEQISRSIRIPESEAGGSDIVLPTVAQRANKVLGFDDYGNPIAGFSGSSVSAAMEPVVSAATLAAARAQFGASGLAVSVKDAPFLAAGDGATDDTAAITAAVAAASTAGHHVYWPAGTYLTYGNIPGFHNVAHYGPGNIRRSGADYAITPASESTVNILHVSTTGSDANDGLGDSQAMATVQKAADVIAARSLSMRGRWEIVLAAGTYTQALVTNSLMFTVYPIILRGPVVSGSSPAAIIKTPSASTAVLEFQGGGGVYWTVRDLTLEDATTDYAVRIGAGATVLLENIRSNNCKNGVLAQHGSFTAMDQYCDFNGLGAGLGGIGFNEYYNSTHALSGPSVGNAVRFRNFEWGIWLNEGCQGHMNYARIEDCTTGMRAMRGCGAVNTNQMRVYRCGTGFEFWGNSWFNNTVDFGSGGNECTVNVKAYGGSPEVDYLAQDNKGKTLRCVRTVEGLLHTGTVSETVLHQEEIRSWMVSESQHASKWTITGQSTLANPCTLRCWANDGTTDDYFTGVTIPTGTTEWRVDIEIAITASNRQRCMMTATYSGGTHQVVYGSSTLDLKNKVGSFRWSAQLGAVGDSLTVHASRYETTLGG